MLEEIIMPTVLKSFGLSDSENISSLWAVRTRKGVCSLLSTKRSNVTVDLIKPFSKEVSKFVMQTLLLQICPVY